MTKYLWLVTLDQIAHHPKWNNYHSAVVVAETKNDAKYVLSTGGGTYSPTTWVTPEYVSVKYLGIAGPGLEDVICVSHQENKGESK